MNARNGDISSSMSLLPFDSGHRQVADKSTRVLHDSSQLLTTTTIRWQVEVAFGKCSCQSGLPGTTTDHSQLSGCSTLYTYEIEGKSGQWIWVKSVQAQRRQACVCVCVCGKRKDWMSDQYFINALNTKAQKCLVSIGKFMACFVLRWRWG